MVIPLRSFVLGAHFLRHMAPGVARGSRRSGGIGIISTLPCSSGLQRQRKGPSEGSTKVGRLAGRFPMPSHNENGAEGCPIGALRNYPCI